MHQVANKWRVRAIAILLIIVLNVSYTGSGAENVNGSYGNNLVSAAEVTNETKAVAADAKNSPVIKAELEYWRFTGEGTLYPPIVMPSGKLLVATNNGWISMLDNGGKELKRINTYSILSAPAVNKKGQVFAAGTGARIFQYDEAGNGGQIGIYYFKGKKEQLQSSAMVTDGEGTPYFAYQHAILSLSSEGEQQAGLLPENVAVKELVAGKRGVYVLGSNGMIYAVRGSAVVWEASLEQTLHGAKLIADDASGGVMLLAGRAIAAYEEDGKVRFTRELAAAPAGGWTSPVRLPGDKGVVVAAELSGNGIAAFRLADGAELWRISASGAGGFGPAALAPDLGAGTVLAGGRSGAVYAIDGSAGSILYTYGGHAAVPASGVAPQGSGRFVYASANTLIAAGPVRTVAITYAAASIKLPLNTRLLLTDKLKLSDPIAVSYRSDNPAVVRINERSVVTPVAVGAAHLYIEVTTSGYKGQLKLPIQVTASALNLKVKHESKKVIASGKSFTVQTVIIPKGMPVTAGLASRKIGVVQPLLSIAKDYQADAAINGTYFEAYGGIPEPYGTVIVDGNVEHIGNTGTAIGFTWDGNVVMDTLRVKILGGTNGSFKSPNNWYAYFINRTPAVGASSAIMFTPKRGAKLGFALGTSVTVSKGVVTKISKKENVSIPANGYVLVYTGSEEKLSSRFQVGTKVDYKIEMTNLSNAPVAWSRVHTAIGAGPRLVKDGKPAVNPAGEGFSSSKILTDAAGRSGILVKKDGTVVIATVSKATIKQWSQIMIQLGAEQAMNLDGGASSGLYAQGKLINTPGRLISNGLVFGTKLKW
ncbi:phosphodiester glycosidase family protein [Bacillus sp. FJAT-28004]|uniref:phosphodiester glycosidase family protein n=1 Tax=Bacillus sp. FJAT-28004 TaxID=1679165 RepID=UPI0006B604FE|nr:phosphodiester glycosidase family protein [Bacillus sp. FJAT-28004]